MFVHFAGDVDNNGYNIRVGKPRAGARDNAYETFCGRLLQHRPAYPVQDRACNSALSRFAVRIFSVPACLLALTLVLSAGIALAQPGPMRRPAKPGPMLKAGIAHLQTLRFHLDLVRSSQTVAALKPKGAAGFDFIPGDWLVRRSTNGYYHLGDIDLRLRFGDSGPWQDYSTAFHREPVKVLPIHGNELASANLAPTLPANIALSIVRTWRIDGKNLALHFQLTNKSSRPVTVGSLGIPMIFDNILTGRTLAQVAAKCSFDYPYIGEDAGYVQVTRLSGHGPALVIIPEGRTPLQAWKPIAGLPFRPGHRPRLQIFHDPTPRSITFEGFQEWMVYSGAYQQNQWKHARPWNKATTLTLQPGQSRSFGLIFLLSPTIRGIQQTLIHHFRPVAVGVPGYVLPQDIHAQLFLHYQEPVTSITVNPAGSIAVTPEPKTRSGWMKYELQGKTWGRARLSITYKDGTRQTVSYYVIKPEKQTVADLGHFLFTKQWYVNPHDPFHRSPSVISYDFQTHSQVTQESRVWIAGLSDEAGAGSWLAAAMKEFGQPNKQQVDQYEEFVDHTLWGHIQYKSGPRKYGVRKSLFYYQPNLFPPGFYSSKYNWKTWSAWSKKQSEAVDRSYDYPHVAVAYWTMYRLARDHQGLVTSHPWQWYLEHAYQTSMAMVKYAPYYARFGQMEGDVFLRILQSLQREGWTKQAESLRALMHKRAELWDHEAFPFGSEMPWDSTGQEEVYAWTHHFGFNQKARLTLHAILGFDPSIPSWGYNGSATHYWDFLYAGGVQRLEYQIMHYGAGLNAIPVLRAYRQDPKDLFLLRIGYGGTMGELTNINQQGFASCGFHSYPDMLSWDPYSGDYGPGFFGFAFNTATYVTHSARFGWLAFGGNLSNHQHVIHVTPLDAFRMRVYLAPYGLWLSLDAGTFRMVSFDPRTQTVHLLLAPAGPYTHQALLRISQPAKISGVGRFRAIEHFHMVRGMYAIPLRSTPTEIVLKPATPAAPVTTHNPQNS